MVSFQTNIDLLTFETADSNNTLDISETELSHYLNTINTGINKCNEYYLTQLNKVNNNNSAVLRDKVYDDFVKELKSIFKKAKQFEANKQLKLIEQIQHDLTCEANKIFGKSFLSYFDDTLQNITIELMMTNNNPIEESKKMKQIAFQFLNQVYTACKPFEAMTWIIERLYDLNWVEQQQEDQKMDNDDDDHHLRMETIFTFIILVKSFRQSVIQQTHKLNQLEEFFNNFVNSCKSPLLFLENVMKESHLDDKYPDVWELQIANMISCILDAIEFYYSKMTEYKGDQDKLLESARFLLVLIFDKFILNYNMSLSKKYYDQFHPRYNVSATTQKRNTTNDDVYTLTGRHSMNDLVHRCLTLASQLGCSFDKLLYLRKSTLDKNESDDDDDDDDDYQMKYSSELSLDGIISILALSIYDKFLSYTPSSSPSSFFSNTTTKSVSINNHSLLPIMIDPVWIGKHCIGFLMNLLGNPDNTSKIDKAILILLFLSDNVDNEKLKIDLNTIEQKFDNVEKKITLSTAFQTFTSVVSMTNDATLRFLGYQLIDQFINLSMDETRLYLLTELLENCPYPTMKTASIGLLKNQIVYDHRRSQLQQQQQEQQLNKNKNYVFNSRIIMDKFIPIIFNEKNTLLNDNDQDTFWDTYNYHMQALNFYYYLLSWDSNNQTTVKEKDQLDWMQKYYLKPLMNQCQNLTSLYQNNDKDEASNNEINGPKLFQLNLLQQILDDIKRVILNIQNK